LKRRFERSPVHPVPTGEDAARGDGHKRVDDQQRRSRKTRAVDRGEAVPPSLAPAGSAPEAGGHVGAERGRDLQQQVLSRLDSPPARKQPERGGGVGRPAAPRPPEAACRAPKPRPSPRLPGRGAPPRRGGRGYSPRPPGSSRTARSPPG
jgi:hypothetical protein